MTPERIVALDRQAQDLARELSVLRLQVSGMERNLWSLRRELYALLQVPPGEGRNP